MELESGRLEHHVRVEDHAALADERDGLARRLREADEEAGRLRKLLDAERQQASGCCSAYHAALPLLCFQQQKSPLTVH